MGSWIAKMSSVKPQPALDSSDLESPETFHFHPPFSEDTNNGLYFNDIYLPEEVVRMILGYIPPENILLATLVCKKWCNIIKSELFWFELHLSQYRKKPKKLPWYVYYGLFSTKYFNRNLIKNGNGQERFKHWQIVFNYGDEFRIEDIPSGSDPLPPDIPEFNGYKSCFATSYYECNKFQEISLEKNRLMQFIFNKYKPHIYLSEWVAGRFDCGSVYTLWCKLFGDRLIIEHKRPSFTTMDSGCSFEYNEEEDVEEENLEEEEEASLFQQKIDTRIEQWQGKEWTKVEMVVKDYPKGVKKIVFQHEGKDTQFWKGHYGSKMAGGVLKILFDSIDSEI